MTVKALLISSCILLLVSSISSLETVNGKIKITTVTTSGCIFTVDFILNQLAPTYELYGEFLDIEFVPWGRTVNNGDGTLTCQFGVNDCFANRLHRCVLNMLKGNQKAQMDYMACEFTAPYPALGLGSYTCVRAAGVSLVLADYCVNNPGRDTLDQEAQEAAAEPMSILNAVPSVILNGNIDREEYNEARQRLAAMTCFALANDPTTGIVSCQI